MTANLQNQVKAGNWYFFVTCKHCGIQIAFADAPPPEVVQGNVTVTHGPLQIHCGKCGTDTVYRPEEFSILQAAQVH
jgi:transcription elongation factor Elf1